MNNPLLIKICAADLSDGKQVDNIYQLIQENPNVTECYRLDGSKVTAAAVDFVIILTSVAATMEIASFLYQLWKDYQKKGQMYVGLNSKKGVQILISKDTRELEIIQFQKKINMEVERDQMNDDDEELLYKIKKEHFWIKTK